MKILKFKPHLAQRILAGSKTTTWRLFDDKDLCVGDELILQNSETGEQFATAEIVEIQEKKLGNLAGSDFDGHERYKNQEDMLGHYRDYYGDKATLDTDIKMIRFSLTS